MGDCFKLVALIYASLARPANKWVFYAVGTKESCCKWVHTFFERTYAPTSKGSLG
jgi:hypothetical protein